MTCGATGRCYVGQTTDLTRRLSQHRRTPPLRMKADVQALQFFDAHFRVDVLARADSPKAANALEQHHIRVQGAAGDMGYNDLKGAPAVTPRYHAMAAAQRRRKAAYP